MHVRALRALPNAATPVPSNSFLLTKRCLLTLAPARISQHVALHLSHTSLPSCQAAPPSAACSLRWSCHTSRTHGAWLRIAFFRRTVNLSMIAMSAPGPIRQASAVSCMTGFCGMFPGTGGGMSLSGPQLKFSQQTIANLESASNPLHILRS